MGKKSLKKSKKNLKNIVPTRRPTRWRAVIIPMRTGFWDKPFLYGLLRTFPVVGRIQKLYVVTHGSVIVLSVAKWNRR